MLGKRSYDEVTGRSTAEKEARLRRVESFIAKYIYGADHDIAYARFFVQDGLVELEQNSLGTLAFRLETGAELPRHMIVSIFFIAQRIENVSVAVKNTLAAIYTSPAAKAALAWIDLARSRIHNVVCAVGCLNSVSPGVTSLVTCVMRGHAYNTLKTIIYPFSFPKDMYLELGGFESGDGIAQVYCVIIYGYNNAELRPELYIAVTAASHQGTVLNILKHRFAANRFAFLDRFVAGPVRGQNCVGVIRRLGHCLKDDIHQGIVHWKGVQVSVIKIERFCVDLGTELEFV